MKETDGETNELSQSLKDLARPVRELVMTKRRGTTQFRGARFMEALQRTVN